MMPTKADLLEQKASLLAYLTSKIKACDWHAVQDAASDIREIEAKLEVLVEAASVSGSPLPVSSTPTYFCPHGHGLLTYDALIDRYRCHCGVQVSTTGRVMRDAPGSSDVHQIETDPKILKRIG
jgi:hypothetical protein